MNNVIQQISNTEFKLTSRGSDMTLTFESWGGSMLWVMNTVNASVRAHNRGFPIPKFFDSLQDVEKQYKSWRGIAALLCTINA